MSETRGVIIIKYYIDDELHKDIWDEEVDLKYLMRVLEQRKATRIQITYA